MRKLALIFTMFCTGCAGIPVDIFGAYNSGRQQGIEANNRDRYLAQCVQAIRAGDLTAYCEPYYFKGYHCTHDCSGHVAGYNWAGQNRVSRQHHCESNSRSFTEGCLAWLAGR